MNFASKSHRKKRKGQIESENGGGSGKESQGKKSGYRKKTGWGQKRYGRKGSLKKKKFFSESGMN